MLGFSPSQYYYYMWKYISPLVLLCLLVASIVQMGLSPPGYNAWIEDTVSNIKENTLLSLPETWNVYLK